MRGLKAISFRENPYENLKGLQDFQPMESMALSPRYLKTLRKNTTGQKEEENPIDIREFIDLHVKKAENSTIQQLKSEIEEDLKKLMSPEFNRDDMYEVTLCNYTI